MKADGRTNGTRSRPSSAILVSSHAGQATIGELERLAQAGVRPRKDYVELARALDAEIIDSNYMAERAAPLARFVSRYIGLTAGQVCEGFLQRRRYDHICAWADRIGLPLALLYKLARSRRDLVLISGWPTSGKKAPFFKLLKIQSHLKAITNSSSVQIEILAERLHVPRHKLHLVGQRVDTRFWRPGGTPQADLICSVGWEARDYATLAKAIRGLDLRVQVAVGTHDLALPASAGAGASPPTEDQAQPGTTVAGYSFEELTKGTTGYRLYQQWKAELGEDQVPDNLVFRQHLEPQELRALYRRSLFVVVPLYDVEFDAGVTSIAEAMAMGKAVIVTRTQGQRDFVREGENGIYVPPRDAKALRSTIERLARHPEEAERMGRAGRTLIQEHHSLDAYVRRLTAIIKEGSPAFSPEAR